MAIPVYPACAGIDLYWWLHLLPHLRLPRMRGDRPHLFVLQFGDPVFTPHARGSTATLAYSRTVRTVYPACAGIDPCKHQERKGHRCLPRMRGDRPQDIDPNLLHIPFTPHARGSTPKLLRFFVAQLVYPACAGIDLTHHAPEGVAGGLPRMRGDRPDLPVVLSWRLLFTPHARGST